MRTWRILALGLGAASVALASAPVPALAQDGGAPVLPPVVGPEVNVSSSGYGSTAVTYSWNATCGDTRCLLTWDSYSGSYAMPVDSEGQPVRRAALLLDGFVGQRPSAFLGNDFVVGTYLGGDLGLVRLSPDGVPTATVKLTLTSSYVGDAALAWNGSRLLVLYREQVTSTTANNYTLVLDANLAVIAGPTLFVPGPSGDVPTEVLVGSGGQFVLLSNTQAWAMDGAGQIVLGPVALPMEAQFGFDAVSAGGAPVLLTRVPTARLIRLGADLRTAATGSPLLMGLLTSATLAWNGTNILVVESDSYNMNLRRFNLDLGAVDPTATTIATPLSSYGFAGGRGSEFVLFVSETRYTASEYGIYAWPLNAGGRPRTTTGTLVSVAALQHSYPFLVAQPAGYLAVAAQGENEVAVMPLGADGQPVASRPPTELLTTRTPTPVAVGTSPAGGMAVVGQLNDTRGLTIRFDGLGQVIDNPPLVAGPNPQYRGGMVWNGTSYLLLAGNVTATVGADGSIGTLFNYFFPAGPGFTGVDAIGTTPLCAFLNYRSDLNRFELAAMRFDQAGMPIDAQPISVAPAGPAAGAGVSLAHDGTRYLAAMDSAVLEANDALTSELRVVRIGTNGQAADASSTLLRRATGAPPVQSGTNAIPAITNPTVVYDGRMYWVVWREQGLWVRRVGTDARVLDAQPIKLLDEPFEEFAMASQGSGAVLLAYSRLDDAPDVQAVRLKARLITTDSTGTGGTGGAGRGGTGGVGGVGGRGGAGGAGERSVSAAWADAAARAERPESAAWADAAARAGPVVLAGADAGGPGAQVVRSAPVVRAARRERVARRERAAPQERAARRERAAPQERVAPRARPPARRVAG